MSSIIKNEIDSELITLMDKKKINAVERKVKINAGEKDKKIQKFSGEA